MRLKYFNNDHSCLCPSQIETSQLICSANQLTGFYMRGYEVFSVSLEIRKKKTTHLLEKNYLSNLLYELYDKNRRKNVFLNYHDTLSF